jgi:hypothetical protein
MNKKRFVILCLALLTTFLSMACMLFSGSVDPLMFEPDRLPDGRVGMAYQAEIQVTENRTPVGEFAISKGTLPAGLEPIKDEREEDIARISGVPRESGTFTFTVSVWCYGTNVSGQTGEQEYTLVVGE